MSDPAANVGAREMSLRDYIAVLRRRKWLVIIPTVLVTVVALAMSLAQEQRYRAETDVLLKDPPSATALGAPERPMQQRVLQNELERARGSSMVDEVRAVVGDEPDISARLAVAKDADVITFRGESNDAERAADAANAYARVFIDQRRASLTEDLEARATVVRQRLTDISAQSVGASAEQLAELETLRSQYEVELESLQTSVSLAEQSGASVIDAAQVPDSPFEPTILRTTVLAMLVGLLIGVGTAFLVDHLDQSLRDEGDLAQVSGLPVLAVIPKLKDWKVSDTHVITREQPTSPPAEAYRALRTSVQFLSVDRQLKIIQITSPKPGDGKTTTSTNLALSSARSGLRVVLVDCDLRRPRVHEFFDLPNEQGFTTAMVGATIDEVRQKVDGEPNLTVISSGPTPHDPSELLMTRTATSLVEQLAAEFDLVVIDSPPVLVVADPLVISACVDGLILVASANGTDRRQVSKACALLAQVDAPVIGTVLNAFDTNSGSPYAYQYAYGRYETAG